MFNALHPYYEETPAELGLGGLVGSCEGLDALSGALIPPMCPLGGGLSPEVHEIDLR